MELAMHRLKGKVAMVTGGRRGIGYAIAKLLAYEGADIAITDRKTDGTDEIIENIKKNGCKAIFIEQDPKFPEIQEYQYIASHKIRLVVNEAYFKGLIIIVDNAEMLFT